MKKKSDPWFEAVLQKYIFSDKLPPDARLLNTIYLVGLISALLTLIVRTLAGNNIYIILIVSAIFIFVFVMMLMSNLLGSYAVFRWIVLTLICDVFFPGAFFALGGIKSSVMGYFILSIVLVFFLTWGRSRIIFLIIHLALLVLCYYLSSQPFFSRFIQDNSGINIYFDNIFTIIVVGLCIGFILIVQNRIYIIEKKKADSAGKELEQRNKLLEVVNETAEMLLSSDTDDLGKALLAAMDLMSRAVDADHIYI